MMTVMIKRMCYYSDKNNSAILNFAKVLRYRCFKKAANGESRLKV